MTDNEIIKALECCSEAQNCTPCRYEPTEYQKGTVGCCNELMKNAVDLINCQKAEIERYKGVIKILENDVQTSRAETIREFAEKLKALIGLMNEGDNDYSVTFDYIDNLVKEMTEGENG